MDFITYSNEILYLQPGGDISMTLNTKTVYLHTITKG
jgi:hypothetical protein